MNQIEIKPITKQVTNIRVSLDINPAMSFVMATVYYEGLLNGVTLKIEGAEYDAWGSDDNYIYDLILSKLGLERA